MFPIAVLLFKKNVFEQCWYFSWWQSVLFSTNPWNIMFVCLFFTSNFSKQVLFCTFKFWVIITHKGNYNYTVMFFSRFRSRTFCGHSSSAMKTTRRSWRKCWTASTRDWGGRPTPRPASRCSRPTWRMSLTALVRLGRR